MNKRIRVAAVSAFVSVSAMIAQPSQAGSVAGNGGSTEITQIMNNAELGMQTVQEEMSYVQHQMNTYYSMLQQKPIGVGQFSVSSGDIQSKFQAATGMYQRLTGLYGSVSNMKDFSMQRFQSFAATGLDWNSYVSREKSMVQNRNDRYGFLNSQERDSIESVKKNYDAVQQYQEQIGSTLGTHGAMTVMNGQMNTLLGQTNQMLEQMAVHNTSDTADKQDALAQDEARRKAGAETWRDYNRSIYKGVKDIEGRYTN